MQTSNNGPAGMNSGVLERVTFYHWIVFVLASLGWTFDCMDQRIFALAREPALAELLPSDPVPEGETAEEQTGREQIRRARVR